MKLGKPNASGRRRPVPIASSAFEIEANVIILTISQEPDISMLHQDHGLNISEWNSFQINTMTGQTNRREIFAGYDAVIGPATVIEAEAARFIQVVKSPKPCVRM